MLQVFLLGTTKCCYPWACKRELDVFRMPVKKQNIQVKDQNTLKKQTDQKRCVYPCCDSLACYQVSEKTGKLIWVVLGKQEYLGVMRQLSLILIVLQGFLKCHKFGLRRECSDFLPEHVASCKLALMTNKTIMI